jgi:hypothetical protein
MACSKIQYDSKRDAQTHLNYIKGAKYQKGIRRKRKHKIPLRSYYCDECKKWHLTSKK